MLLIDSLFGRSLDLRVTPSVKDFTSILYGLRKAQDLVGPAQKLGRRILPDAGTTDETDDHFHCVYYARLVFIYADRPAPASV